MNGGSAGNYRSAENAAACEAFLSGATVYVKEVLILAFSSVYMHIISNAHSSAF
jgi:hypothetical protein